MFVPFCLHSTFAVQCFCGLFVCLFLLLVEIFSLNFEGYASILFGSVLFFVVQERKNRSCKILNVDSEATSTAHFAATPLHFKSFPL